MPQAPTGWVLRGNPEVVPASRLPTGRVQHGTQAARVTGAMGEGIVWDEPAEIELTELYPTISAWAAVAARRGAVALELVDGEGTVYPLGDQRIQSAKPELRALSIGGERVREEVDFPRTVRVKMRVVISKLDPETEDGQFFLDGVSLTGSASAYPQQARMGPAALFGQAGLLLRREGGEQPLAYDAEAWTTDQPIEPGDRVTVDEKDTGSVVARAQEVQYEVGARQEIPRRDVRLTEAQQRLKELLEDPSSSSVEAESGGVSQNAATFREESPNNLESVFGRKGNVSAKTGDYDASQVVDNSALTGGHVDDALELLARHLATRNALTHTSEKVASGDVFTLPVEAQSGDPVLQAGNPIALIDSATGRPVEAQVTTDMASGDTAIDVAAPDGTTLSLDEPLASGSGVYYGHRDLLRLVRGKVDSVFGREGAVTAKEGDYQAGLVTTPSSDLGGDVAAALGGLDSAKLEKADRSVRTETYQHDTTDHKYFGLDSDFFYRVTAELSDGRKGVTLYEHRSGDAWDHRKLFGMNNAKLGTNANDVPSLVVRGGLPVSSTLTIEKASTKYRFTHEEELIEVYNRLASRVENDSELGYGADVAATLANLARRGGDLDLYGFEDGLGEWTAQHANVDTSGNGYNGGSALTANTSDSNTDYDLATVPVEGRPVSIRFRYNEQGASHGGGLFLRDAAGIDFLKVGTSNPTYEVESNTESPGVGDGTSYGDWAEVRIWIDWNRQTARVQFEDLPSGEVNEVTLGFDATTLSVLAFNNASSLSGGYDTIMRLDDVSLQYAPSHGYSERRVPALLADPEKSTALGGRLPTNQATPLALPASAEDEVLYLEGFAPQPGNWLALEDGGNFEMAQVLSWNVVQVDPSNDNFVVGDDWADQFSAENTLKVVGDGTLAGTWTVSSVSLTSEGDTQLSVKENIPSDATAGGRVAYKRQSGADHFGVPVDRTTYTPPAQVWAEGTDVLNTSQNGDSLIDQYAGTSLVTTNDAHTTSLSLDGSTSSNGYRSRQVADDLPNNTSFRLSTIADWDGVGRWGANSIDSNGDREEYDNNLNWQGPGEWIFETGSNSPYSLQLFVANDAAVTWTDIRVAVKRDQQTDGPAVTVLERIGSAWNDLSPRAAIGQLKDKYDYVASQIGAALGDPQGAWLSADAGQGVRLMSGTDRLAGLSDESFDVGKGDAGQGYAEYEKGVGLEAYGDLHVEGRNGTWQGVPEGRWPTFERVSVEGEDGPRRVITDLQASGGDAISFSVAATDAEAAPVYDLEDTRFTTYENVPWWIDASGVPHNLLSPDLSAGAVTYSGSLEGARTVREAIELLVEGEFDFAYSSLVGAPTRLSQFEDDMGMLTTEQKGAARGVATLTAAARVPEKELPERPTSEIRTSDEQKLTDALNDITSELSALREDLNKLTKRVSSLESEDTTEPNRPSGLGADGYDGWVDIYWDGNNDDTQTYRLYRNGVLYRKDLTYTYAEDHNVQNGQTYRYEVSAVDEAGNEGPLSVAVEATPTAS